MIRTIEDLVSTIIGAGRTIIDSSGIAHRPSIGDMYEGLTRSVLEKAVFDGLGLNIVTSSFIENKNGEKSHEMDLLLIEGEGRKLPYVEKYVVPEAQVIAVFQVKKTLNKQLLSEAYFNLKNVYDICDLEDASGYRRRLLRDAYVGIFETGVHRSKPLRRFFQSTTQEHIFDCLRTDAQLPVRVVIAYKGYRSEKSLRKGFQQFLSDHRLTNGFSPLHFPNLIINDQFSLVKGNGMPYISTLSDGKWPFYNSSSGKPILHLLELIWSRLSYRYNLDHGIFGDDLEVEGVNRFLSCNMVNVAGRRGWNFEYMDLSKKYFVSSIPSVDWEPVTLTLEQHHVIAYLCKYEFLRLTKINWWLSKIGAQVELDSFVAGMLETGLVYVDSHKELRLLTEHCQCMICPGVGFVGADNKTGKLTRWVEKRMGKKIENVLHVKFS
ncbi:MAG TPA: hypothetical protein PKJ63_07085 [Cyclobacteriaceae bacterium]|nr:hypothetical protein [Cyclobacteriaceae bacterium]